MLPIGNPDAIADALLAQNLVPEMPVDVSLLVAGDVEGLTSPDDGLDAFDPAEGAGQE